jgi:hypothetical protein
VIANSHLTIRPVDDHDRRWVLVEELKYCVPDAVLIRAAGPKFITVRADFETDLASVPRLFWPLVPPFGRYTAAAVLHDYLYQAHEGTRLHADLVFLEAMRELRVKPWRREVMFHACRAFGSGPWMRAPMSGGLI